MRLMFARLEDETVEPEDVDFEDYNTIHSDNYSFDEEDDEDYETESETDSGSDSDSESSEPAVVDEEAQEASRAFANHLPNVNQLSYSLERAEYTVADFVRMLLRDEYPQYSSIIERRRADSTHRTVTRLISRIITRYQERIYPTQEVNSEEAEDVPQREEEDESSEEEPVSQNLDIIARRALEIGANFQLD
jgi:hypothetical protein